MDFVEKVLAQVRHATPREKKRLRSELEGHLEDHAGALTGAGYDPGEARTRAEEAMGDPEELGRELNGQYPLLWLVLSRILPAAVLAVCLALAWSSPVHWALENIQARWDPVAAADQRNSLAAVGYPIVRDLDIRVELEAGDVLYIYQVGLDPDRGEAGLSMLVYDEYLLGRASQNLLWSMKITDEKGNERMGGGGGFGGWGICTDRIDGINVDPGQKVLYVTNTRFGQDLRVSVPLPWEEEP